MRLITGSQIEALIRPADLLRPLRRALIESTITVPNRTQHALPGMPPGSLVLKPAWRLGAALGVKIIAFLPGNSDRGLPSVNGMYVLLSGSTGEPQAVIDGAALTTLRTAAVSALALDAMANPNARTMLLAATGALAPQFARAHASVRKLERIWIWGRTSEKVTALVRRLGDEGLPVAPAPSLEQAARAADIISCATLSQAPLIRGEWLKEGAHLDLVGSFRPDMREADNDAIASGGLVVDTRTALDESGDLIEPLRKGLIDRQSTPELGELLAGASPRRGRITIFKTVGTALADLVGAEEIVRRIDEAK
jgi:ornithine cyclodeaminase